MFVLREGMPTPEQPVIRGVVETVLYSENLDVAVAFYRDVLGLVPMKGDPNRFQAFDAGRNTVLLLFKRRATLTPQPVPSGGVIPPHDGDGPHHVGLAIATEDYEAWRARLRNHGVALESETQWEKGGRSIYFRDPDHHLVELVTPGIWANY